MAAEAPAGSLTGIDYTTLVVFFGAVVAISVWSGRRQARSQQEHASSEAYFLAERSVPWWAVSGSLFMSNIGAEHFVGLSGTAAQSGIAVGWYEWGSILPILSLAYIFMPVYASMKVRTMPEYIEKRYSKQCSTLLVGLSLALYVLTKISATLYAGQIILGGVTKLDPWVSVILLIAGTAVYTAIGGLGAVVYTEAMQTGVLLIGGFLLMGFGFAEVGGMGGLREKLPDSYFHLFLPPRDPDFPWTGLMTGYFLISIFYWACDQVTVQRVLAANTVAHGRAGAIGATYFKVLPVFLMVMPGLIARVLMEQDGTIDPANPTDDPAVYDQAYPYLMFKVMPRHTLGILLAAILASLMSSLASVFNSCATLFTMDIYRTCYPRSTEKKLVWVGRVSVLVMAVLSVAWLPIIPMFGQHLFLYIQAPPAFLAPSILALFIWGMYSPKPSATGGYIALWFGTILAAARFGLSVVDAVRGNAGFEDRFVDALEDLNFLHFAVAAFVATSAVLFVASSAFPDKPADGEHAWVLFNRGLYSRVLRSQLDSQQHDLLDQKSDSDSAGPDMGHVMEGTIDGGDIELTEPSGAEGGGESKHAEVLHEIRQSASSRQLRLSRNQKETFVDRAANAAAIGALVIFAVLVGIFH